jgi:predicted nucleotidyltransferase
MFPTYKVLQIDFYRKQYGNGSIEAENELQNQFINDICQYKNAIVEFSGLGKIADNLIPYLPDNENLIFLVKESVEICIQRIVKKDFSEVPYPTYPNMETLDQTIIRLDKEINSGEIEHSWNKKVFRIMYYDNSKDIKTLPIIQYSRVFEIKKVLESKVKALFLFGSLSRNEGDNYSDTDLFILTKKHVRKILIILRSHFSEVTMDENEILIRDEDILSECYVIHNIRECKTFYETSGVKDVSSTVLIDCKGLKKQLNRIIEQYHFDFTEEILKINKRIDYFIKSLPTLIKRNDEYKYYFHVNIIIHELIRLISCKRKCSNSLYLPKMGKEFITDKDWKSIIYQIGDSMKEHYEKLLQTIRECELLSVNSAGCDKM